MSKYEGVDFYNGSAFNRRRVNGERFSKRLGGRRSSTNYRGLLHEGTFPLELIPKIGEMGLFGCNLSGYECAGLSNVAYGVICKS